MSQTDIIVVCEDNQHAAFIQRFFRKRHLQTYIVPKPPGGAGDQFVLENFPKQLDAVRKRGGSLVAMIDGDRYGAVQRNKQLEDACKHRGIAPRVSSDNVAVLVPQRNIETWFAYLDGEQVDETTVYPKLRTEKECRRHVDALWTMCTRDQTLRNPSPASLEFACSEYRNLTLRH